MNTTVNKYFVRKEQIEHVKITGRAYSLSHVNALHSVMDKLISKDMESKSATKYLDLYLMMFWWLQKNKDLNQTEQAELIFRLMTGHVDNSTRVGMIRITIHDLVERSLPIDTKGSF